MGDISEKLDNQADAEKYYEQSAKFAEEAQNNLLLERTSEKLYHFNKLKDPAKALAYYERFVALRDSIFHSENRKQLSDSG